MSIANSVSFTFINPYTVIVMVIDIKTQFEIERRRCGQSMTNFRFLVAGVKIILQVVILFSDVLCRKLTKNMEKMSKINPVVALH